MSNRGRSPNKVVVNLRMPRGTRAALDAAAQRMQVTRNELISMFIGIGLDSMETQQMPAPGSNGTTAPDASAPLSAAPLSSVPALEADDTEAQQAIEDSVNRAILEVVHDTNEADLGAELDAMAMAEFAPQEVAPHVHQYVHLLGSDVDVAGIRHGTYLCGECGQQKFDAVH